VCVVVSLALAACTGDDDDSSSATEATGSSSTEAAGNAVDDGARTRVTEGALTVESTSTRAGLVSDDDVLVTVTGASGDLQVELGDRDISDAFTASDDGAVGLVTDLPDGDSDIIVTSGDDTATLTVTNHSKNGPVFSGPHLEPWVCTTEAHGLGAPTDEDCDAPSKTEWSYVATDGSVRALDDPSSAPADVATATVDDKQVPFIVRTETGVIDRGIYTIIVVDPDPTASKWSAEGWNERLVYRFGGGCGTGYTQGEGLLTDGIDTDLLGRGYALATNTLDTFQSDCNAVLSAEAALMTREHFIEQYGVPQYTIGDGGSGGAIQQLLTAHNYPGILDALSPSVPFPDAVSISGAVSDCGLLHHYYESEAGTALTDAQRAAIDGQATTGTCDLWITSFLGAIEPSNGCSPELDGQTYDAETRPDGVRCTLADINVNYLGRDEKTGFANRPLDNVGIEYGRGVLEDGTITVDQFLDLNEQIGGYDIDGNFVADRESASDDVISIAYKTGAVIGEGPLQEIPILLRNVYTDLLGDIHTRVQSFSIRDRLATDDVDDPNLLLWTSPSSGNLTQTLTGQIGNANDPISVLDEWLTTGKKPATATNRCTLTDGTVIEGGWDIYDEPGPCADSFPVYSSSRIVAGQERDQFVIKCRLQPVDASSYGVSFTEEQAQRLAAIFPDGVCDWSKPGAGAQAPASTWQSFGSGS
ncbi:MAG TPA: DUF6351 family protein, partial [Acidimicrobiia bacterium]|nr:DUF6351 family protein [Acidimicrobiia bacterium]